MTLCHFCFDLEDGKPKIHFHLNGADGERFMAFMAECDAYRLRCLALEQALREAAEFIDRLHELLPAKPH